MNAQDCLQILRDVKDVAFATVDEKGLPQIRMKAVTYWSRSALQMQK